MPLDHLTETHQNFPVLTLSHLCTQDDDTETRGFAAACLLCLCKDPTAHPAILESGGAEPLQALAYGPATWLRGQVVEMLTLLGVPVPDPDSYQLQPSGNMPMLMTAGAEVRAGDESEGASPTGSARRPGGSARGSARPHISARGLSARGPPPPLPSSRPLTGAAKMRFHFFSFQIHGTTGFKGFS